MKQTKSLSEFSSLSEHTRLYPIDCVKLPEGAEGAAGDCPRIACNACITCAPPGADPENRILSVITVMSDKFGQR